MPCTAAALPRMSVLDVCSRENREQIRDEKLRSHRAIFGDLTANPRDRRFAALVSQ
jgi:hypothetical protein